MPAAMGLLARMGTLTVVPKGLGGGSNQRSMKPKRPPWDLTGAGVAVPLMSLAAWAPATPATPPAPAATAAALGSEPPPSPAAAESSGFGTTACRGDKSFGGRVWL